MTVALGQLPISAGVPASFPTSDYQGLIIGNESGLSVVIGLDGTSDSRNLYPGTVDYFPLKQNYSGTVKVTPEAMLNNVAFWPSSFLSFDAVGQNERINISAYPMTLPRLTNVGNVLTTVGTSGTLFVQNDGNAAATSIVEATVAGDGASAVSITNDAVMILGDVAHPGSLTMRGPLSFLVGSLTRIAPFGPYSVTTVPAFFNHNLGVIPDLILLVNIGTSSGSLSCDYDDATMTSTQVKLTSNLASGLTVRGLAIKF